MMGCFPQNPNGWAGIPLISTAPRRTRKNNFGNNANGSGNPKPRILISNNSTEYDENAMSRLAIHAHGAPLILAGRYRNRVQKRGDQKQQQQGTNANCTPAVKPHEGSNATVEFSNSVKPAVTSSDNSTTGSDENSPSNGTNQETCLPRIIKPRKRRKKDRKPQNTSVACLPEATTSTPQKINTDLQDFSQVTVTHDPSLSSIPRLLHSLDNMQTSQDLTSFSCKENTALTSREGILDYPIQQDSSDTSFKMQLSSEEEPVASCCCRICDPSCRIWAFPLRRSCSDNTAELELQKSNKDVGVIGSNRSSSARNGTDWRGSSKVGSNRSLFRNGSFSDSGDSGCDLLSGINFGDEPIFFNGSSNQISTSPIGDDRSFIDFPTAETLLTESINEISKKLMETVDLRSDIFSSDSSSVFSDSVLSDDMLFNIENLTRSCNSNGSNNNLLNNNTAQVTYPSHTASSDLFTDLQHYPNQHHHLISNNNNNNSNSTNNNISNVNCNYLLNGITGDNNSSGSSNSNSNCNNNFVMFHEKDRENEIFNCFDMVWSRNDRHNNHHGGFGVGGIGNGSSSNNGIFGGTRQLLPIEEQRIQLQTTG